MLLVPVLLAQSLAVAAAPPRLWVHPEFAQRMVRIGGIGVLEPTVRFIEVTPGSRRVSRPDWGEEIQRGFAAEIEKGLRARKIAARSLPSGALAEHEEIRLLFEAVGDAVLEATYHNAFPDKLARFEYSVGDLGEVCARERVDAVVLASGYGRLLVSAEGNEVPRTGDDRGRLSLALVDCSGQVLWFEIARVVSTDLRSPVQIGAVASAVLATLPEVSR